MPKYFTLEKSGIVENEEEEKDCFFVDDDFKALAEKCESNVIRSTQLPEDKDLLLIAKCEFACNIASMEMFAFTWAYPYQEFEDYKLITLEQLKSLDLPNNIIKLTGSDVPGALMPEMFVSGIMEAIRSNMDSPQIYLLSPEDVDTGFQIFMENTFDNKLIQDDTKLLESST